MTSFPPPPSGLIAGKVHRFAVRAYFEDTDLSGVVYHANYLRYMERGRTEFFRLAGISRANLDDEEPSAWALRRIAVEYHRPARLDDQIAVHSVLTGVSGLHETWVILGGHAWETMDTLPEESLSLHVTGTNGNGTFYSNPPGSQYSTFRRCSWIVCPGGAAVRCFPCFVPSGTNRHALSLAKSLSATTIKSHDRSFLLCKGQQHDR